MDDLPTVIIDLIGDYTGPQYEFSFTQAAHISSKICSIEQENNGYTGGELLITLLNLYNSPKYPDWLFRHIENNGKYFLRIVKMALNLCNCCGYIKLFKNNLKDVLSNYKFGNPSNEATKIVKRINVLCNKYLKHCDKIWIKYIYGCRVNEQKNWASDNDKNLDCCFTRIDFNRW